MRLLLAANNQATRRNEIIKSYLQLGSSSNRYAPRLPQQETKSSTKQLPPTDPILGPENLLKTGFAQKDLPSIIMKLSWKHRKHGIDSRRNRGFTWRNPQPAAEGRASVLQFLSRLQAILEHRKTTAFQLFHSLFLAVAQKTWQDRILGREKTVDVRLESARVLSSSTRQHYIQIIQE